MLPTPLVPLPPTLPTHGRAVHTSCTFSCPEISVWLLKVSLALLGSLLYPKKKRIQKKVTYKSIIKNLDLRNIVHGEEESLKRKMAQYLKSCSSLHCWEITHHLPEHLLFTDFAIVPQDVHSLRRAHGEKDVMDVIQSSPQLERSIEMFSKYSIKFTCPWF